ncbi:DNA-binding domain-containing protein [Pseudoalteromonas sp. SSDWG2]|uniref:HvfC family RiPP maturation protein n=1 Tax=Pseudoalteromonas sp. SSDWG2 TaxID=3139391 RepID=UPI003BAAF35F
MQFKDVQAQFSAHIRDPENNSLPEGIEDRRMKIYRELFFNNVNSFLESGFPVLRSIYDEQAWLALARKFFAQHQAESPYFVDISKEFVTFLAQEYEPIQSDPPFLLELAHYEWVELCVATAKLNTQFKPVFNVEKESLYVSDCAQVVCYHYPVQTISVDHQPQNPDETPSYICVYRDTQEEVQFLALNAMTALLLDSLSHHLGTDFESLCLVLQKQAPQFELAQIQQGARQILQELIKRRIVLTLDC